MQILGFGSINPGLEGVYDFGETIQLLDSFASPNAGSGFVGYRDVAGNYITTITMAADTVISAVFEQASCVVQFTTDGNGIILSNPDGIYTYGNAIDLTAISLSANEGYEFSHWIDSGNNILSNSYTVTGNETLMAVFNIIQYTLTVNITGNGSVTNIAGDYDIYTEVEFLYEYAHPSGGDEFLGYTDENGTYITNITMNADRTITAVFGTPTYNVLFNSNGGSEVSPYLGVASGSLIAEPSEPTNGDLVFSGWFSDSGTLWDFANDTVMNNVILHAKWREEQILTYDANGSSGSFSEIQYTNEWFNLNDGVGFARNGYTLMSWNSLSSGQGLSYTLGQQYIMPAHHVTMYADWSPNTYSLYYDANFGTGSVSEPHKTDEIFILLTGAGIEREGYVITAWEIEGNVYPLYSIFTMLPYDTTANALWALDSDKDGISDIDELLVGTDTLNKFNYPYIGSISGIVLDIDGNPVAGNTLVLNSVARHTITDADGQFSFNDIYLAPHTLTLRSGYTNLGIYDLEFINDSHNNAVILDNGSPDSVGSTRAHVNYLFDTLYIVIQYNDINQWEISGLSFTEGKDTVINPPTGQVTTKWYKQLFDKLLELLKFFIGSVE